MLVTLTWTECRVAVTAGTHRRLVNLEKRSHEVYGQVADGTQWDVDIEAVAAEMAAAKGLGLFHGLADSAADDRAGDIAPGVQVRHTRRQNGSLICHDRDPDDHRFVLVVGSLPTFRVVGSIMGAKAKDKRFWRTDVRTAAYFVPQSELAPPA